MQRKTLLCFALLSCCCCAVAGPRHSTAAKQTRHTPPIYTDYGSFKDGSLLVYASQIGDHRYETIFLTVDKHIYKFADERVRYRETNGHLYYFNDDEYAYEHEWYLSPDHNWLFVVRKCGAGVNVAYLYHRVNHDKSKAGRFVAVHPNGRRFDDAALHFFARTQHFRVPDFAEDERVFRFQQWTPKGDGVIFSFATGHDSGRERKGVDIVGCYNFQTRRFILLQRQNIDDKAD